MSDNNLVSAAFQMQRTAVEQARKATLDSIQAQKVAMDATVEGMDSFRTLAKQNADLSKGAIHAYLEAVENTVPEGSVDFEDLHDLVDRQFSAADESQAELMDALKEALEESNKAYDSYAENYADMVEDSFDSFLEAHEQLEAGVERTAKEIEVEA